MTTAETASEEYDVVVVGGGIAGLTAALVLGRMRRRVVLIDAGHPRNAAAAHVHGFPTRDGTPPAELLELARAEVRGYGVEVVSATVSGVDSSAVVLTAEGQQYRGRQVILASGLCDVLPEIDGLAGRWGRDVLQCPYCHGYESADKAIAVLATAKASFQQAQLVRTFSSNVVLVLQEEIGMDEKEKRGLEAMGIGLLEGPVCAVSVSDGALDGLVLSDGRTLPCEAVFLEPAARLDPGLTEHLELDDDGCIVTDELGRTSREGIWAVGNAADPAAQVITSAGDAYRLAVAINATLLKDDFGQTVASIEDHAVKAPVVETV